MNIDKFPKIGFGTFGLTGDVGQRAVGSAYANGYRLFDTALAYGNQSVVADALSEKSDVIIVSKLTPQHITDLGIQGSLEAIESAFGTGRVKGLLIHAPKNVDHRRALSDLSELKASGQIGWTGVSNYTVRHLEILDKYDLLPDLLEVEIHPFLREQPLREFCAAKGIKIVAYRPLICGKHLADPDLVKLAAAASCTVAQLLLAWSIAKDLTPIPCSSRQSRIIENYAAAGMDLQPAIIEALDGLHRGLRTCSSEEWSEFIDD